MLFVKLNSVCPPVSPLNSEVRTNRSSEKKFTCISRRRESSSVVARKQVVMASGLAYFDPNYENLSSRINPPRVSVDNTSCKNYTLVQVDSVNKPGILLEVVQILSDLDLSISKAYISSDGGWFMDVTDQHGNKITDTKTINDLEQACSYVLSIRLSKA